MVSFDLVLVQILNGLTIGFSIALVAIGLSLVFGVMEIVNFAHGEFYMAGAYGIFVLLPILGSYWLAVFVAAVIVSIIAIAVEQLTIRPLRGRDPHDALIVTFGLVLISQQLALELFGGRPKSLSGPIEGSIALPGGNQFPLMRIAIIAGSALIILLTWLLLERTRLGVIIRASSQDIETARTLGVPANRVYTFVFIIGAFLAAVAAGFLGPIRGLSPGMSHDIILEIFIVIIVGGMGSIPGAVIAALLIGLLQALSVLWLPAFASQIAAFALLIIVLLVRPEGLLGTKEVEA